MGQSDLYRFYQRKAHNHIFFGLVMAAQEVQMPLKEAIAIYRRRTGDESTKEKRLYQMAGEMTEQFKMALSEAHNG